MSRNLLTSLLFKFSPSTQEIKKSTLSKIILNLFYLRDVDLSIRDIHKILSTTPYSLGLSIEQCERAISRLLDTGSIKESNFDKFKLDEESNFEIEKESKEFENKINFLEEFLAKYKVNLNSFLQSLHYVFSEFGQHSINIISGRKDNVNIDNSLISSAIKGKFNEETDKDSLEKAVLEFIKAEEPKIIEIKWLLAQNSFLFRLLGSDVDESSFSKEYFKDARFYLDTNVLLNALEPNTKHHDSFNLISKEIKSYNASLYVFEQNIRELDDVIAHKYDLLIELLKKCPESIIEKSDSFLSDRISKQIKQKGKIDVDELFDDYSDIDGWCRKNNVNVNNIEDTYGLDDQRVEVIRERVKRAYKKKNNNGEKYNKQAEVDAKLLLAALRVKDMYPKTWVMTLDTTLPLVELDDGDEPLVLTIEALIQWLSIGFVKQNTDYAKIFSDVLTEKLLPSHRFFTLEDFQIFSRLEKDVKELPDSDIIGCVEYIRENVGTYNLSKAEDREKLHYEIEKYFSRTDLKYKDILIELNKEVENQKQDRKKTEIKFENYKETTKKEIETLQENNSKLTKQINDAQKTIYDSARIGFVFIFMCVLLSILTLLLFYFLGEGYFNEANLLSVGINIILISTFITAMYDLKNSNLILRAFKKLIRPFF